MKLPNMKKLSVLAKSCLVVFGFSANASETEQKYYPDEEQKSFVGPEEYFTGDVNVQMLFPDNDTAHYSGAYVTFQPGARTAWHQHPAGQHMVVTEGTAVTGTRDGRVNEFHAGETVWCPKDIDHWHGATPHAAMTHIALTGSKDGKNVIWKDKVTDEVYQKAFSVDQEEQKVLKALSAEQQALVTISAFTASGDLIALERAVTQGLENGLSISKIKELQMHLYAYAGFPRSLNALGTTMKVVEARKSQGKEDIQGEIADPLASPEDSLALLKKQVSLEASQNVIKALQ